MSSLALMFDCDDTLIDNDQVLTRMHEKLTKEFGASGNKQFWSIYEDVRLELDFVNFPETIDRFRLEYPDHPAIAHLRDFIYGFPFREVVYPGAPAALAHAREIGIPAILSDGDQVFQRYKIRAAGLEAMVDGRVMIFIHKEFNTEDIRAILGADHYVIIDDKPRIHAAIKPRMGAEITTVLVHQGKYAHDASQHYSPGPDLTIDSIGDFAKLAAETLIKAATPAAT
jgi:phosphoglycolate phosphatase-like HAD superfamily hydrolase